MKDYELFSKRQKRLRGEVPDVYQYETIPQELRVQVVHIWRDVLGEIERGSFGVLLMKHIRTSMMHCVVSMVYLLLVKRRIFLRGSVISF